MKARLHLEIVTPAAIAVDVPNAVSVRARDASGSFGLRPGHADLLTVIPASVVSWRDDAGGTAFCAVRGGVMTMTNGNSLSIACREALPGHHLADLEGAIIAEHEGAEDADRRARVAQMQLHAQAVRRLMHYLAPETASGHRREITALFGDAEA